MAPLSMLSLCVYFDLYDPDQSNRRPAVGTVLRTPPCEVNEVLCAAILGLGKDIHGLLFSLRPPLCRPHLILLASDRSWITTEINLFGFIEDETLFGRSREKSQKMTETWTG